MSMVRQSRSLRTLFCMPKIKEPMVKRFTSLFFHWNRKSKIDDSVIISSLAFTPETKTSSDSLCPTILILPHPTLSTKEFSPEGPKCLKWVVVQGLGWLPPTSCVCEKTAREIALLLCPSGGEITILPPVLSSLVTASAWFI